MTNDEMRALLQTDYLYPDLNNLTREEEERQLRQGQFEPAAPGVGPGRFLNPGLIAGRVPGDAGEVGPNYSERLNARLAAHEDEMFGRYSQEQHFLNQRRQRLNEMLTPSGQPRPIQTPSFYETVQRQKAEFERARGPLTPQEEAEQTASAQRWNVQQRNQFAVPTGATTGPQRGPSAPVNQAPAPTAKELKSHFESIGAPVPEEVQQEIDKQEGITRPTQQTGAREIQGRLNRPATETMAGETPVVGMLGPSDAAGADTGNFMGQLNQLRESGALNEINTEEQFKEVLGSLSGAKVRGAQNTLNRVGELFMRDNMPSLYNRIMEEKAYSLALQPQQKEHYARAAMVAAELKKTQREEAVQDAFLNVLKFGLPSAQPETAAKQQIMNAKTSRELNGISWHDIKRLAVRANLPEEQRNRLFLGANTAQYENNPAKLAARIGVKLQGEGVYKISREARQYTEDARFALDLGLTPETALRKILKDSNITPKDKDYEQTVADISHVILTEYQPASDKAMSEAQTTLAETDAANRAEVARIVTPMPQTLSDPEGVRQLFSVRAETMESMRKYADQFEIMGVPHNRVEALRNRAQEMAGIPADMGVGLSKEQIVNDFIFPSLIRQYKGNPQLASAIAEQQELYNNDPSRVPELSQYIDAAVFAFGKGAKSLKEEVKLNKARITKENEAKNLITIFANDGTDKVALTAVNDETGQREIAAYNAAPTSAQKAQVLKESAKRIAGLGNAERSAEKDINILKGGKIPYYSIESVMPTGGEALDAMPVTIRNKEAVKVPMVESDWTGEDGIYKRILDNYFAYPEIYAKVKETTDEAKKQWDIDQVIKILPKKEKGYSSKERETIYQAQQQLAESGETFWTDWNKRRHINEIINTINGQNGKPEEEFNVNEPPEQQLERAEQAVKQQTATTQPAPAPTTAPKTIPKVTPILRSKTNPNEKMVFKDGKWTLQLAKPLKKVSSTVDDVVNKLVPGGLPPDVAKVVFNNIKDAILEGTPESAFTPREHEPAPINWDKLVPQWVKDKVVLDWSSQRERLIRDLREAEAAEAKTKEARTK